MLLSCQVELTLLLPILKKFTLTLFLLNVVGIYLFLSLLYVMKHCRVMALCV